MGKWLDKDGLIDLKTRIKTKVDTKVDKYTEESAGKFLQTDSNGNAVWGTAASPSAVAEATEQWLEDHVSGGSTIAVDDSLTVEGAAADAKATGELIKSAASQPSTSGTNVLWINESSETEYQVPTQAEFDDLKSAFGDVADALTENVYNAPSWEQGSIRSNGANVSSNAAVRTSMMTFPNASVVCFSPPGLKYFAAEYSSNSISDFVRLMNPTTTESGNFYFAPVTGHYYRFVIKKADGSDIAPTDTDLNNVTFNEIQDVKNYLNLTNCTAIQPNDDLDDYIIPGRYYSRNTSVTVTLGHKPFPDTGFILIVAGQPNRDSGTYIRQIAIRNLGTELPNDIAIRYKGTATEFGAWNYLAYQYELDGINRRIDDIIGLESGNLYNKETVSENGYYIKDDGTIGEIANHRYSDYIPVKKGKTYYISRSLTSAGGLYDTSKNWVAEAYTNGVYDQPVTFTVSIDGYVRLNVRNTYRNALVFCEGTTEKVYPPYGKVANDDLIVKSSQIIGNKYEGKTVVCIGDSITNGGRWVNPLKDILNCTMFNRGVSGTTLTVDSRKSNSICERASLQASDAEDHDVGFPTTADLVLVLCGVNDWGLYNPGTTLNPCIPFGDIEDPVVNTTYCGALHWLINNLKTRYPNAKIVFINNYRVLSPTGAFPKFSEITYNTYGDQTSGFEYRTNSEGKTFNDFRSAMIEITSMYGIPVIDLLRVGFSFWDTADRELYSLEQDFSGTMLHDGLHPSDAGGLIMAKYIATELMNMD